jgi:hypothetical protein
MTSGTLAPTCAVCGAAIDGGACIACAPVELHCFIVRLDDEQLSQVETYRRALSARRKGKHVSRAAAVRELVRIGHTVATRSGRPRAATSAPTHDLQLSMFKP